MRIPASVERGGTPGGAREWAGLFARAGLPVAGEGAGKARVVPAAQLPLGIAGDREVVDLFLAERLPIATVRSLVAAALPTPMSLVDLHDVWLGAPAAPAAVVAADYEVAAEGPTADALGGAVERLLGAPAVLRERRRERGVQAYDLRPLVRSLAVASWDDGAPGVPTGRLEMRLRHSPDGVGRPEEVVAALVDDGAASLAARSIRRLRLVMAEE